MGSVLAILDLKISQGKVDGLGQACVGVVINFKVVSMVQT